MKYHVQHDYRSGRGAYEAGTVVDIDEAEAEWLNTDSPGLLLAEGDQGEPDLDEYPADGSADDVLAWVGADLERAQFALDKECEGKQRKGLTEDLAKLIADLDDGND